MIYCRNIHKEYRTGHVINTVLKGVEFTMKPRDRVGLLGRNGAGKSTLIRLIGGGGNAYVRQGRPTDDVFLAARLHRWVSGQPDRL